MVDQEIIDRIVVHFQAKIGSTVGEAQADQGWAFEDPAVAGLAAVQAGIDEDGKIVSFRVRWRGEDPCPGEITRDGFIRI